MEHLLYRELSSDIIGAIISVHNALGPGLLEAPYHNALYYELVSRGHAVSYNTPYPVFYKGNQVGEYYADLTVADKVIVEVKSVSAVTAVHRAQVLNYLRIADIRLGLIVNFHGVKAVWERFVL